jgi:formylmethanofuran dehydrogenase subunit E
MLKELREIYRCEHCNELFANESNRDDHQENCKGKLVVFKCGKCGEIITYYESNKINFQEMLKESQCHILEAKTPIHGSKFEGKIIEMPFCDDCLEELIESLSEDVKDRIYAEEDIYSQ